MNQLGALFPSKPRRRFGFTSGWAIEEIIKALKSIDRQILSFADENDFNQLKIYLKEESLKIDLLGNRGLIYKKILI